MVSMMSSACSSLKPREREQLSVTLDGEPVDADELADEAEEDEEDSDIPIRTLEDELRRLSDEVFLLPGVDRARMKSLWTPTTRWVGVTEEGLEGGPVIPDGFDGSLAAEQRALAHLLRQGLTLVTRNYRVARGPYARGGEIDLILRERDGTLVFVEVRARAGAAHGGAAARGLERVLGGGAESALHRALRREIPPHGVYGDRHARIPGRRAASSEGRDGWAGLDWAGAELKGSLCPRSPAGRGTGSGCGAR